jgi:hypothetical protein
VDHAHGQEQPGSAAASRIAAGLALLLAVAVSPADAADDPAIKAQLERVLQRLQQLEQRNQELERRVQELSRQAPPAPGAAQQGEWGAARSERMDRLEQQSQALEGRVNQLQREAEIAAEEEGPQFEGNVLALAQQVNAGGSESGRSQGRLNYRGDISVTLPGGTIGEARGTAFAHVRFGQGTGVALRPTYTSTVNSAAFETAAGADDSFAILAQAFYQLELPLGGGGFNEQLTDRLEFTLGKIDVFGFFDQNAVAGDEASQFLNNAFVHNPLLDSGGDIAADAYGFAPGLRMAYFNEGDGTLAWSVSAGVFASGAGSNFSAGPKRPLTIVQFEVSPKQINGEPRGNYRAYVWTNGRTTDLEGNQQRHTGYGLSVDQRVGREWNLFGRWGQRTAGDGAFDRALTVGFEHGGRLWGRGHDAVGVAFGWLRTGSAWRTATADGTLTGYSASGAERIAELYYRMRLNEHVELSPDFQLIQRAGGDGNASSVRVWGLRGSFGF